MLNIQKNNKMNTLSKDYKDQLKEMSWSQLEDEYDILQQKGDKLTPEERWQMAEIEEEILFRQETEETPYHWESLVSEESSAKAWLALANEYLETMEEYIGLTAL